MRRLRTAVTLVALLVCCPIAARADVVLDWNAIAVSTLVSQGQSPFAQARFLAITQLAVFEAVNAITHDYKPYLGTVVAPAGASAADRRGARLLTHPFSGVPLSQQLRPLDGNCDDVGHRVQRAQIDGGRCGRQQANSLDAVPEGENQDAVAALAHADVTAVRTLMCIEFQCAARLGERLIQHVALDAHILGRLDGAAIPDQAEDRRQRGSVRGTAAHSRRSLAHQYRWGLPSSRGLGILRR